MNTHVNTFSDSTIRATVNGDEFTGHIVERSHDHEPYVVVQDHRGNERSVRPNHENHEIESLEAAEDSGGASP